MFQVTSMESTSLPVSVANWDSSSVVDITSVLDATSVVASTDSITAGVYTRANLLSELTSSSSHVASELVRNGTIKTSKTGQHIATLSPSSLVTTTRTFPAISTSSLLRSTVTSSAISDWHTTAWTAPVTPIVHGNTQH